MKVICDLKNKESITNFYKLYWDMYYEKMLVIGLIGFVSTGILTILIFKKIEGATSSILSYVVVGIFVLIFLIGILWPALYRKMQAWLMLNTHEAIQIVFDEIEILFANDKMDINEEGKESICMCSYEYIKKVEVKYDWLVFYVKDGYDSKKMMEKMNIPWIIRSVFAVPCGNFKKEATQEIINLIKSKKYLD